MDSQERHVMATSANVQAFRPPCAEEGAEGQSVPPPEVSREIEEQRFGSDAVSLQEFQEVKEKLDNIENHLKRLSPTEIQILEDAPKHASFGVGAQSMSSGAASRCVTFADSTGLGGRMKSSSRLIAAKPKMKSSQISYGTNSFIDERGSAASSRYSIMRPEHSMQSEIYDPRSYESDEGSEDGVGKKPNSRFTVFEQAEIFRGLSTPLRTLGVCLGFVTVVFLWETADLLTKFVCPELERRLVCYLMLALSAAVILVLTSQQINNAVEAGEQTLIPSFGFAVSTLFLAIGSWGVVYTSVRIVVPEKKQPFVWLVGGLFALVGSFFYSYQTRHNALLDIASCATSLGLTDYSCEELGTGSRVTSRFTT